MVFLFSFSLITLITTCTCEELAHKWVGLVLVDEQCGQGPLWGARRNVAVKQLRERELRTLASLCSRDELMHLDDELKRVDSADPGWREPSHLEVQARVL